MGGYGDLAELTLLLFLMVTGYSATRPRRAIQREAFTGFAGWAAMFVVLIVLVVVPDLMVIAILLGMTAGVAYTIYWVGAWLAYEFSGIPEISAISRRQVLGVCHQLSLDYPKESRDVVRRALKEHGRYVVLSALMNMRSGNREELLFEEEFGTQCKRVTAQHGELVERLRAVCKGARRLDYPFIWRLSVRYGEDAVERGIERMAKAPSPSRMKLPGHVVASFTDHDRSELLNQYNIEVHPPTEKELLPHVVPGGQAVTAAVNVTVGLIVAGVLYQVRGKSDALQLALAAYFFIGAFTPLYVYLAIGHLRRAALFGAPYFILIVYGEMLFRRGKDAGWVFMAVVALLHISALLNLHSVCRPRFRRERGK